MKRIMLFKKIPFDTVNTSSLLKKIISACLGQEKKRVFNMNAYGAVMYTKNTHYAAVIQNADIIYPDGWGPVIASQFFSEKLIERINVGDFIDPLFMLLNKHHLSLYLLGCENSTVTRAVESIQKKYPHIHICGYHSGFFSKKEEKHIVSDIKKTKPRLVLVGMGIPKQEYWISLHWKKLPPAVYMGIGGVFYYIAGTKTRAPLWMQTHGLEWLYRFFQEPKRLWRRYTLDMWSFIFLFIKTLIQTYCIPHSPSRNQK